MTTILSADRPRYTPAERAERGTTHRLIMYVDISGWVTVRDAQGRPVCGQPEGLTRLSELLRTYDARLRLPKDDQCV